MHEIEIETPLERCKGHKLSKGLTIVPILRAGLAAHRYGTQDRVADNELPTGSFTMLGADVSWSLFRNGVEDGRRRMLVYLRGSNLLDEDARRHASPLKEFAPLPGRSLGAGVRLEF